MRARRCDSQQNHENTCFSVGYIHPRCSIKQLALGCGTEIDNRAPGSSKVHLLECRGITRQGTLDFRTTLLPNNQNGDICLCNILWSCVNLGGTLLFCRTTKNKNQPGLTTMMSARLLRIPKGVGGVLGLATTHHKGNQKVEPLIVIHRIDDEIRGKVWVLSIGLVMKFAVKFGCCSSTRGQGPFCPLLFCWMMMKAIMSKTGRIPCHLVLVMLHWLQAY